jgi:hypothetical protein
MKLLLSWLVVTLPLAWGVAKSVQKSLPLFGVEAMAKAAAVEREVGSVEKSE